MDCGKYAIEWRICKKDGIFPSKILDTGLASHLCGLSTPEALAQSSLKGAFVETYAAGEIFKSYIHNGIVPELHFARTNAGEEIDLIIEEDGKVYPVEIKSATTPRASMSRNFSLVEGARCAQGTVPTLGGKPGALPGGVRVLPISSV